MSSLSWFRKMYPAMEWKFLFSFCCGVIQVAVSKVLSSHPKFQTK